MSVEEANITWNLHAFVIGGYAYGEPEMDSTGDLEMKNKRTANKREF